MKKLIAAAMTASLLLCSNGVIVMAEADTDVSEETTAEAESDGIDEAAKQPTPEFPPIVPVSTPIATSWQRTVTSTDTEAAFAYVCSECGAEYSYQTDPHCI